jgi:hypothetical protein
MFTGQLPWNGKKQLGMEQTHSKQEIPDPREFDEGLPDLLVDVLRRVTSADRQLRPRSAGETMKMLYYLFNITPKPQPSVTIHDESTKQDKDIEELLSHGLERWHSTNGTYNLGLTRFVLIDLARAIINLKVFSRFVLSQSLTYGFNDNHWWSVIDNPRERLAVSSDLLRKKNEAITARILGHLINDEEIRLFPGEMLENMTTSLLEIGTSSDNILLRQQIYDGIRTLIKAGNEWRDSLNTDQMKLLGTQALEDSEAGDTAAGLIGYLRSPSAVQVVLDHPDEERKYTTLLLIQQTAGSLPSFVQGGVRFRLSMEWFIHRLVQQPVSLIGAYMLAFLGAALGVGMQFYLTYNLTELFDSLRITVSLERGLIIGSVFGFGIFLSRVVVERLHASNAFFRVMGGTLTGGLTMNIAFLVFYVIILHTPPMGWLITLGCILISFAFAISGLLRSRVIRMILSSASIFIAIIGTWLIHVNSASSQVELTPIFKYSYAWPLSQVSLIALGIAVLIGIFGNLINLSVADE